MISRRSIRTAAAPAVAVAAASLLGAAPALARTPRPTIKSFAISGSKPQGEGGVVTFKVALRNAKTCALSGPSSVIGVGWQGRCSKHALTLRVWVPPNTTEKAKAYRLKLIAKGTGGTASRTIAFSVPGEPRLETGEWLVQIESATEFVADFEADGKISLPSESTVTGSWTYKHRKLTFDLTESGSPTVLFFEATGLAGGPFTGVASQGKVTGAFTMKHV